MEWVKTLCDEKRVMYDILFAGVTRLQSYIIVGVISRGHGGEVDGGYGMGYT